jgi:hypothetical protein
MDKTKLDPRILEEYEEIMVENMEIMRALRQSVSFTRSPLHR